MCVILKKERMKDRKEEKRKKEMLFFLFKQYIFFVNLTK